MDTSDYQGLELHPRIPGGPSWAEGRGLRGGVSHLAGGQNEWLTQQLDRARPAVRVLASHYPTRDLNWRNLPSGRIGDLLAGQARNVWLSAHTHVADPEAPILRNLYYSGPFGLGRHSALYDEVNVGSTNDHRAHAAIVEFAGQRVQKTPLRAFNDDEWPACRAWVDGLQLGSEYESPLPGGGDNALRLGLTTAYRNPRYDAKVARDNIDKLLASAPGEPERARMVRCMMRIAAETSTSWTDGRHGRICG